MLINVNGRDNVYQSHSKVLQQMQKSIFLMLCKIPHATGNKNLFLTWKYTRKQSNFFLLDPWSKYWPHVSNRTHTSRIRKRCSGGSSGDMCASEIRIIRSVWLYKKIIAGLRSVFFWQKISNFHFSNNFIIISISLEVWRRQKNLDTVQEMWYTQKSNRYLLL